MYRTVFLEKLLVVQLLSMEPTGYVVSSGICLEPQVSHLYHIPSFFEIGFRNVLVPKSFQVAFSIQGYWLKFCMHFSSSPGMQHFVHLFLFVCDWIILIFGEEQNCTSYCALISILLLLPPS